MINIAEKNLLFISANILGALQKKIKVALQVQKVPMKLLRLTCPTAALKFSPLVAIEPRRRRFHNAVQVNECFKEKMAPLGLCANRH